MKKQDSQQRVGVGVSSVLMILVVLAMTALSLLAFGSARSNESMTRRNADVGTAYYVAADQAQRTLAEVDALLLTGQQQGADLAWYEQEAPENITYECPNPNKIIVKGINKQQVGNLAADIRAIRKPEPYLGKGIKYENEVIRRKEGKSGKK